MVLEGKLTHFTVIRKMRKIKKRSFIREIIDFTNLFGSFPNQEVNLTQSRFFKKFVRFKFTLI